MDPREPCPNNQMIVDSENSNRHAHKRADDPRSRNMPNCMEKLATRGSAGAVPRNNDRDPLLAGIRKRRKRRAVDQIELCGAQVWRSGPAAIARYNSESPSCGTADFVGGVSFARRGFPSTTAAFRLSPANFARFIGDFRNAVLKASWSTASMSLASVAASFPATNALARNGE